jgi:phytoene synthase
LQGVDLEAEVRRVDPDRWLASRFIADKAARADVVALYAFDHELARAGAVTSSDVAAEIRLTWWREAVAEIYSGAEIRRHPVAEAVAAAVKGRSLPLQAFEAMIEARIEVLGRPRLEIEDALAWAAGAQGSLARLVARCLESPADGSAAAPAGVVWGLVLLRRSGKSGGKGFDHRMRLGLTEAGRAARGLSPTAFPAALPATLARAELRLKSPSDFEKRARLTWSALTGRL